MTFTKERQADREEQVARAEHKVEERLYAVADQLGAPDAARGRARDISAAARVHQGRAEQLRRDGDPVEQHGGAAAGAASGEAAPTGDAEE